jgi:prepilin-type N-terminal cleavage/methylation domain-containing protein
VKIRNWKKDEGFTLIELLLVILIIAILAVIGISQFTNFAQDSRDAATKANLQVLRNAIAKLNGIMRIRCNYQGASHPPIESLRLNDITLPAANYSGCTTELIQRNTTTTSDAIFIASGSIPPNPWSIRQELRLTPKALGAAPTAGDNVVGTYSGTYANDVFLATTAEANARTASGDNNGWRYDPSTGIIYPNTSRTTSTTVAGERENYW